MKNGRHIPALDGLRGIAVITVMLLHFNMLHSVNGFDGFVNRVLDGGWVGVDLFFVLSGFLITGILYDTKNSASYFRTFYMRRALRIFPLYYAFVALLFIGVPLFAPDSITRVELAPWFWTYTSNFLFANVGWEGMPEHTVHLWSLAVEEQFYLLWPLVVFLGTRAQLMRFALLVVLAANIFRGASFVFSADGIAGYALLPARMDALAIGALIALAARGSEGVLGLVRYIRPVAAAGVALLIVTVGLSIAFGEDSYMPALSQHTQLFGYPATALMSAALVMIAITSDPERFASSIFTWKPLMAFGKYSYALYLIHVPVRDILRTNLRHGADLPVVFGSQLIPQTGLYVFGIGISFGLALLSWHCFEKHFLELKTRFSYAGSGAKPRPSTALPHVSAAISGNGHKHQHVPVENEKRSKSLVDVIE